MSRAREIVAACATPAELEGRPALTVEGALDMLAALDEAPAHEVRLRAGEAAWRVFDELVQERERGFLRMYLGTGDLLGR